jgi:hypothetical protein
VGTKDQQAEAAAPSFLLFAMSCPDPGCIRVGGGEQLTRVASEERDAR